MNLKRVSLVSALASALLLGTLAVLRSILPVQYTFYAGCPGLFLCSLVFVETVLFDLSYVMWFFFPLFLAAYFWSRFGGWRVAVYVAVNVTVCTLLIILGFIGFVESLEPPLIQWVGYTFLFVNLPVWIVAAAGWLLRHR